MLTISHFVKQYPGAATPVLSIPNLQINSGIYWLKGNNGSGKSSLLKSIAGLIPFTGHITVNGLDINTNRMAYTKIVNHAEAEPQYPGFLSGKELIDFYHDTKKGNLPTDLIQNLDVDAYMQSPIAVYSSGMIKKLSLVLAFIGNPVLVLLDEPLTALDVNAIEILEQYIKHSRGRGISAIITSHQSFTNPSFTIDGVFHIADKKISQI